MLLQIYSLSMLRILSGLLNHSSNISPERSILRFSLILFLYMCFYLILLFYKWLFSYCCFWNSGNGIHVLFRLLLCKSLILL